MSKIIHGVDKTALKSIISPLFMDQTHLKRIPYGSNATSLYKRITTFSITNQFRNLSTDASSLSGHLPVSIQSYQAAIEGGIIE